MLISMSSLKAQDHPRSFLNRLLLGIKKVDVSRRLGGSSMNISKLIINFIVTLSILLSGSALASQPLTTGCLVTVVSVNCSSTNQSLTHIKNDQTVQNEFVTDDYQANAKQQNYTSIEFPQLSNASQTTLKNIGVVVSLNWVL